VENLHTFNHIAMNKKTPKRRADSTSNSRRNLIAAVATLIVSTIFLSIGYLLFINFAQFPWQMLGAALSVFGVMGIAVVVSDVLKNAKAP
jgi:Na+/melibiose symporter-like transporter